MMALKYKINMCHKFIQIINERISKVLKPVQRAFEKQDVCECVCVCNLI